MPPETNGDPTVEPQELDSQEAAKWNSYYRDLPEFAEDAALHGFHAELVELVRLLLPMGGSILEAGAGGGWQSLALARAGFETTLLDVSQAALRYAKRTFERHNLTATFQCESIFSPATPSFDFVFNLGAVEHYDLNDQARFLRGMAERSRRFVLVVVPNRQCYWYWLWRIWRTEVDQWPFGREIPRWSLKNVFDKAGVRLVGHRWLGSTWTEGLLAEIPGLSPDLHERILRIHRTSLVPPQQRCYLTAALGVVQELEEPPPGRWHDLEDAPAESEVASLAAELAEELARVGALLENQAEPDQGQSQPTKATGGKSEWTETDPRVAVSFTPDPEQPSQALVKELVEERRAKTKLIQTVARLRQEKGASQQAQLQAEEQVKEQEELRRLEIQRLESETAALRSEIAASRKEGADLRHTLDEIYSSRFWRLAHAYWTVRRLPSRVVRWGKRQLAKVLQPIRHLKSLTRSRNHGQASAKTLAATQRPFHADTEPRTYDLLILPIIDWDFRFQRPQQLACQFADHDHRIFYLRTSFQPDSNRIAWNKIRKNVYNLEMPGPDSLRIYTDKIPQNVLENWLTALARFRREFSVEQALIIAQLPFWEQLASALRERWGWKVIYDCMDEHSGFSTNTDEMIASEQRLIAKADLVLASSKVLQDKIKPLAQRSLLLRNAADFDHFHRAYQPESFTSRNKAPVIGYYGAISEWFDVASVEAAAKKRPEWKFVLIGSTFGADVTGLQKLRNVELPGEVPYEELPDHLHSFDVALVPFKRCPLTEATNPVKFYEYFAAGKPVVATALPELSPHRDLFYAYSEPDELVPKIEEALSESSQAKKHSRVEMARQNTWQARHESLDAEITHLFGKAVVIIVSFNNLDYLKLCLESLWTKTVYPNFEIIVVDNGSNEEVREYLRKAQREEDRLKIVLNEANLGFPKANNIGIQAAGDCEFVVLLNDDTVVTRGWLSRLLHYLEQPDIELIGPVTNWCGNEARIEVDYDAIEDMEEFARRYTAEHEGESTELRVLAMYCVAMRRALLERIGLLDERFGIGMFEDDDFSRRVRESGGRVVCGEDIFIHHWGRSSFGRLDQKEYQRLFEENQRKYEEKWGSSWRPHRYREAPDS